jgi:hypothetical protein
MYVSEDIVKQFLLVESENCMEDVYEPGVSPIFRMLDTMLKSDSYCLKELTLSAIYNAICGSKVLGALIFSQFNIVESIFEFFDEPKTYPVILKEASNVIQECARQGHFTKDNYFRAIEAIRVAKKLIGSVEEVYLPIEGIRIV